MATPGLQKLNIPQNRANSSTSRTSANSSDLKHVAARNMSNASRATGATSYGIFAQRSKVGSGGIFNIKTFYGDSIAAQRRYLNSNRQVIDNNFYGNQKCSGSDNGMNKFMAAMMAANMLAQLGAQTADVVKSMKGTGSTKPTNNTEETNSRDKTSGTNTSSTKSLGEMKSADNSTALEAALSKAKNDQDAIPDKINTANSELAQLKGQTDGLKGKYEEAQTTLDKHNKEVSETSAKVNELTNSVGAAEMSYNSAVQHKDYLESQLSKATDIVAKNSLEAQIAKAKNNVKNEKEKLDKLKDDLEKTQDKLNNLNSQTNDLKQAVGDAKDAYDKNVKDIDTKQKEISQLEQDKAELDKEIPKQKDRLIKLQKQENDELTKIDNKIKSLTDDASKLLTGINVNDEDGLSSKDQKRKAKSDKLSAEANKLKERQTQLQRQKAIRNLPIDNVPGNTQFKSGLAPTGEMMYVVDGKEVSKEEYEQKKAELMSQT